MSGIARSRATVVSRHLRTTCKVFAGFLQIACDKSARGFTVWVAGAGAARRHR